MKSFVWWAGLMLVACGTPEPTDDDETDETDVVDPVDAILALTGDATNGADVYDVSCSTCHSDDGAGSGSFPSLLEAADRLVVETVLAGPGLMPDAEFLGIDEQDIADVVAFVKTL